MNRYPEVLSAQALAILLHYYYSFLDYHGAVMPDEQPDINILIGYNLLELAPREGPKVKLRITERGRAYVARVLSTPLPEPVTSYVFPDEVRIEDGIGIVPATTRLLSAPIDDWNGGRKE